MVEGQAIIFPLRRAGRRRPDAFKFISQGSESRQAAPRAARSRPNDGFDAAASVTVTPQTVFWKSFLEIYSVQRQGASLGWGMLSL